MPSRQFSPLELNQLQKHGLSNLDLSSVGEKPVEYLTRHALFCNLDFLVTQYTLIPRLESEEIVTLALKHLVGQRFSHPAIADLGTGSGCLALSLAHKLVEQNIPYTIYLSDISPKALSVAEKNAERLLPSTTNLFFQPSDLLDNYPHLKFDLLIANLPYIPSNNLATLPESVKDFEPHSALDGGPNGTTIINRLLVDLHLFLSPLGLAILEIDDTQSLTDFSIPKTLNSEIKKDTFGVGRFLLLHLKNQDLLH